MDVKYHKRKMSLLSEEEKAKYIKALQMKERLAYWRAEMLKAYRNELAECQRGTFHPR